MKKIIYIILFVLAFLEISAQQSLSVFINNQVADKVSDILYNCNSGHFLRVKNQDSQPATVTLNYGGELTNGTDYYVGSANNLLPSSVSVPANDSVDISFRFAGGSSMNKKHFKVSLDTDTFNVYYYYYHYYTTDSPPFTYTVEEACSGQSNGKITISHSISESSVPSGIKFEYSIDGGATWQTNNVFDNLSGNTYTVRGRAKWGCTSASEAIYLAPASANAGGNIVGATSISNGIATFTMKATAPNSTTGETGTWTVVGGTSGITITNPAQYNTTVTMDVAKTKTATLRWTLNGQCETTYDDAVITYRSTQINPHLKSTFKTGN